MWSGADASYLAAITAAGREYTWHGTLTDADGTSYSFDAGDIVKGSGQISRMVSSQNSLDIGTVYTAELTIRLYLSINRYKLYNGTIDLYCDVKVGLSTYSVPMGIFTISSCTQEIACISITAYDAMASLDEISVTTDQGQDSPYNWISYVAGLGGLTLGTSQADIEAMPNGTLPLSYVECEQALTTMSCRDCLAYLCAVLCANAYIGRDGLLYIQQYEMVVTDDIAANERYTSSLSDFTTNYTAVTLTYYDDGVQEYYAEPTDDGLTFDLGVNPFLQYGIATTREAVVMEILDSLNAIYYEPYAVTMPLRPELDPMDVLTFSGNQASSDVGAITSITYKLGGQMSVKCSGGNPKLSQAKSKATKTLNNLINKVNETDWYSYYFENTSPYVISDTLLMIGAIAVQTVSESKLTLIYTVNFDAAAKGRVTFYVSVNGTTYKTYKDTFWDGENIATIHFTFNIVSPQVNYVYIYAITDGYSTFSIDGTWNALTDIPWETIKNITWTELATSGTYTEAPPTANIPIGYSQITIFGRGLAATESWNGMITCSDTITGIELTNLVGSMTDSVTTSLGVPRGSTATDTITSIELSVMGNFSDSVGLVTGVEYTPYINTDRVTLTDITASGAYWYGSGEMDDGTEGILITTDDLDTADITQIEILDSGGYWQLSFDSGTSWVGYSGGTWSSDTMMTTTGLSALSTADLTAQGNTVRLKVRLEENCTISTILFKGATL